MNGVRISIVRDALSLPNLKMVGSSDDLANSTSVLGVIAYTEPALQARNQLAPPSNDQHGDLVLGWTWQQSVLNFTVAAFGSASEQETRDAVAELRDAITQALEFEVRVTVGDSAVEVWTCNPGSVAPAGERTSANLRRFDDPWVVSLPCFPVRG